MTAVQIVTVVSSLVAIVGTAFVSRLLREIKKLKMQIKKTASQKDFCEVTKFFIRNLRHIRMDLENLESNFKSDCRNERKYK